MALRVIEGAWEEIVGKVDLHGRYVRVLIDDGVESDVLIHELSGNPADLEVLALRNPWLRSLQAWADSHAPLDLLVDDGRDTLYEELTGDPG